MYDKNLSIATDAELALPPSEELITLTRHFLVSALSASTRKFYAIDFRIFSKWCDQHGFSSLPSTPETIAQFLVSQANDGIRPATLTRRLAAIRMAHDVKDLGTPTQHKAVKAVMQGMKRQLGTAPKKKSPATAIHITNMVAHCPDTLAGKRDKALLLLGFAGAFRRSELVGLKVNDIEYTAEGIKVIIRQSKTDQEGQGQGQGQGQVIAIPHGERLKVVDTLKEWLSSAGIKEGYLFRSIKKGGAIHLNALSGRSVATLIKHYAGKAGLSIDAFSGHSLRSGFITSGAASGADLFKLMEVSRHKKPETVMGYVRDSKLFENHAGKDFL
jgi:site-specific recombinase XerD